MDANILSTQITYAGIVVYLMQRIKDSPKFPWLQAGQKYITRTVSIVVAFFGHAGISYVWDPSIDAGGNRHLSLAIPTFTAGTLLIWHWLGQFVMQEFAYQATINKVSVTTNAAGAIPAQIAPSGAVVVPESPKV